MEQTIIKQCKREGLPLPAKIANAPEVQLGLELYYNAFHDLSSSRQQGWSLGRIPWLAIHQYATAFDIDGEVYEWLHYLIGEMDQFYLAHHAPKKPKGGKTKWGRQGALNNSQAT